MWTFSFYFLGGGGLGFAVSCKKRFRRGRSIAQNPISETKVTAYSYKSFGQAFSKACRVEGQRPRRSRRSETPQAHSNRQSKIIKRKANVANTKKRNAAQKVGTTDVTSVTI